MGVDAGSVYSSVRIRLDQLDTDLKGVFARLNQLEASVTKTTTSNQNAFQRFGSFLKSTGILPIASLAGAFKLVTGEMKAAEDAYENQSVALAKIGAVLRSTGGDAWTSTEAIAGIAESLQKVTLYADDEIESMQAVLLGFRSIRGDNFTEATKQILNMATVMKQDLGATAQQVGKALDLLDWNALSRQGFKFTEQQKAAGNAMKAAGNLAGAQKIILDELNSAFGGAAVEAAKASNGNIQLANAIDDVNEEIGRAMASGFKPMRQVFIGIAEAVANAVKKANDYRDAVEATGKGKATMEQQVAVIKEELAIREANLRILLQSGDEALKIKNSSASREKAEVDALKTRKDMLEKEIVFRDKADAAAKRAAQTKAVEDDKASAAANLDLEIQQERIKIYDKYRSAIAAADDMALRGAITQEERDARVKSAIQSEIEALEALKVQYKLTDSSASVQRIDEQIAALRQMNAEEEQFTNNRAASLATQEEINSANAEMYQLTKTNTDQLNQRGKTESQVLEIARQQKIASIEASSADQKYKDRAIQSTNALYDALKDDAAWNSFSANASKAFQAFSSVFSALSDLVTTLANNRRDSELNALEDVQEAETEALSDKYDTLEEALDTELQAKLYASGLAEAATVEQYQAELDAAKATGDQETIDKAQAALDKATIDAEYADKKRALEDQRAAEEKALEEKQAKEKAEINYKAEMAAWRMKTLSSYANAAQAIVGALSAPPYWPWNSPFVAAATVAGGLQVAAVKAAKPVLEYATGGIVPGTRTVTDSVPAMLTPSEMILNDAQQATLFGMANGGGGPQSSQQPMVIVFQVDGLEMANLVANYINDGKVFIKSRGVR